MTRIGCEPDPGFLATGTKLSEQFSCVYFDRYMSIDLKKGCSSIRILEYPQIIPDGPSTRIRDPGSRSLTPMFDKS